MAAELIGGLTLTLFQFWATKRGKPYSTDIYSIVDPESFLGNRPYQELNFEILNIPL